MSDESRIQQLLEEVLESGRAPEDVCADFPELLWRVTEGLRECRAVEAQLDAVFPRSGEGMAARRRRLVSGDQSLPQIPGYQVEAVLGRGGVGVVYRAKHLKLNRQVALKMLLSGGYADPHELARFTREAEAVASLRHAHIVQVYDVGEFDGQPYFTMEMMDGGSLAQKLAGTPQPTTRAASLLMTLATATHAAHLGGIVHRDLKPSNVLLTADGTPKISDFGLARNLAADRTITEVGARVGTPSYMAPEQALGTASEIGPATDVYGLGAILYEMLTGRPPFRAESASETQRQLIANEPARPSRLNAKVPRDLETVCLKCLRKVPARRYESAAALAEDLGRFGRGEPIAARRTGSPERLAKWARRRPAVAVALVTGALLAAVLVGAALWLVADRAAMVRDVEADLRAAAVAQERSAWPEATAALERVKARLATRGSADLRRRLDESVNHVAMVGQLDAVRLWRINKRKVDDAYLKLFTDAGLGDVIDDPARAAARLKASPIKTQWVVALDDWMMGTKDARRQSALLAAARAADPDRGGWRERVRDHTAWDDPSAVGRLAKTADVAKQPVHLLVAVGTSLKRPDNVAFLRRVQETHPGDIYSNLMLAITLMKGREGEEAVAFFRAAVAARPDSGGAHYHLGLGLRAVGRTEEAVRHFERAIRLDPTDPWAHATFGDVLRDLGRLDEALERQREALRIDPSYVMGHNYLGHTLLAKGLPDEALAAFRRAIEVDPRHASGYNNVGVVLAGRGRGDESIESFRKALELDDEDPSTHSNLGAALQMAGRNDEALEHLRRALEIHPDHATAHVRTANLLRGRGQRDEAIKHYREALRIDPKDGVAHLNLALTLQDRGELAPAIHHYRQALARAVPDPRPMTKLAALLVVQGKAEEARRAWRQVLDANPAAHDAWHGYAELCLYLGDDAEYRRARLDLLGRFGDTIHPLIAERTARACLLRPMAEGELPRVAALAERAVAARGSNAEWAQFLKPLLTYRKGQLDAAIELTQMETPGILGPAPRLVQAMAMHRAGRQEDAMKALASASLLFDWRSAAALGRDAWIFHALRREAEAVVLPNCAAFLEGQYQPAGNDERLALIPACQFHNRPRAVASLYSAAFATDPGLAEDLASGCRYNAACAAALAGGGAGDGTALDDQERSRWRDQARQWLRADLAAWAKLVDAGERGPRHGMRREAQRQLTHWQADPELASLREPKALAEFPRAEQTECFALWNEVTAVLHRALVE